MGNSSILSIPGHYPVADVQTVGNVPKQGNNIVEFIWKERTNRLFLCVALAGTIAQFILFKTLYPFPDFFSDSYSYLYAAEAHLDVSIWPIGYSKFLWAFHQITYSDTALVAFQYFFFEMAAVYLFFTFIYFYRPSRNTSWILFIFLFCSPLFLYLCNYCNSDPLFAAISIWWFTELVWVMNRPRSYQILTQAILLFLAFTIRNNAYYYPVIAAVAFILSRRPVWAKWAGSLAAFVFIVPFVIHTKSEAKKMTGTAQFSLFTGWQLANNALYMYPDISVDKDDLPDADVQQVDALAKQFFTRVKPDFQEYLGQHPGNFFIQEIQAPLKQYLITHYKINSEYSSVVAWGKASAVFDRYGTWMILHNPVRYVQDFGWLNTKNYFLPGLEKMEVYNLGHDNVSPAAKDWFRYKDLDVRSVSKDVQGTILYGYPIGFLVLNFYLLGLLGWGWMKGRYKNETPAFQNLVRLTAAFWLMNFCFCVLATIIVFRYEIAPMIIFFLATLLLLEKSGGKVKQTTNK